MAGVRSARSMPHLSLKCLVLLLVALFSAVVPATYHR